jgi:hypothetical protein
MSTPEIVTRSADVSVSNLCCRKKKLFANQFSQVKVGV